MTNPIIPATDLAARFEAKREECEKRLDEAYYLYAKMLWKGRAEAFAEARDMARAGAASAVPALGTGEGSGGASPVEQARDLAYIQVIQTGRYWKAYNHGVTTDIKQAFAFDRRVAKGYIRHDEGVLRLVPAETLGTEAGTAETGTGSVHEGPADLSATPPSLPHPQAPNTLSEVEEARAHGAAVRARLEASR